MKEAARVELSPLTLLAGANSSGKSSFIQPFLLVKQTIEAPFDPGPLLLNGPNARFSDPKQLFTVRGKKALSFGACTESWNFEVTYEHRKGLALASLSYRLGNDPPVEKEGEGGIFPRKLPFYKTMPGAPSLDVDVPDRFSEMCRHLIYLPGLRGNPQRAYPRTAIRQDRDLPSAFPGTFDSYFASIIYHWGEESTSRGHLDRLSRWLGQLGLTWSVEAVPRDGVSLELQVARTRKSKDWVNIADVGLGVSQVLPVLVALLTASPNQVIYLEQPELHLHPRAQWALAEILVEVASSETCPIVILETHSATLLLGVQTAVAKGKIAGEKVSLNWFSRDDLGLGTLSSVHLDKQGRYGEWPVDFDDVSLAAEREYLDAVTGRKSRG